MNLNDLIMIYIRLTTHLQNKLKRKRWRKGVTNATRRREEGEEEDRKRRREGHEWRRQRKRATTA